MLRTGNRTIKIKKQELIDKIKENKKNHIELYEKAVIAYKEEALEQLDNLVGEVENGVLDVKLDLVTPIDNSDDYDAIIEMFEWEVEELVELGQDEFRQYVQDETEFAQQAHFSNTYYTSKF